MTLVLDVTNACDLRCKHCLRDWNVPVRHMELGFVENLLVQAKRLGFRRISFTGGEPSLHPEFAKLVSLVASHGFRLGWMSNGNDFQEHVKLMAQPAVAKWLDGVCFSLDGPDEETHDSVRGAGSFKKVLQAAQLCKLKNVPFSFKMIVHKLNAHKTWEAVRLAGAIGARGLGMAVAHPSHRLVTRNLMPSVSDFSSIPELIKSYARATRGLVHLEGNHSRRDRAWSLYCFAMRGEGYNVTSDGKLTFCCNLSRTDGTTGVNSDSDVIADLNKEHLAKAIAAHAFAVADLVGHIMAKRGEGDSSEADDFQCLECHKYFSKLDWLRHVPGDWRTFVWGY